MSHTSEFADVRRAVELFGATATLITVNESLSPHVVSAVITVEDGQLIAEVGSRTRSNLLDRPGLALVWNPEGGGEYQLILDGIADRVSDPNERGVSRVRISVPGGILHRLAGLPDGPPSCRSLAELATES